MVQLELSGKKALITGGTSGIGRAVAETFVAAGCETVIVGRRAAGQEIADRIGAISIKADVGVEADVSRSLEEAGQRIGLLDVLVLNAGFDPGLVSIEDLDTATFERVLAVSLKHVWWGLHHGVRHLRDGASIIATASSIAAFKAPDHSAYAATKDAVVSLMRSAAVELGPRGIRANAVLPGGR